MDRNYVLEFGRVTERAALACAPLVGRGDPRGADEVAVKAMRSAFLELAINGRIVIGEGERDDAPMLYIGEEFKNGNGVDFDIAVDPLEGTNLCAYGQPGAISVLAAAIRGHGRLMHAPDIYMEKMATGPGARGVMDLNASTAENLHSLAKALGKPIEDITVVILDRDRHEKLIAEVREQGCRIRLIGDGDVAAALATAKPSSGIDCLMGIGGAPEGVLAAAAIRCLGGEFQGRFWFRNDEERKRAQGMGVADPEKIYTAEELAGGNIMFAATGVTSGDFLEGVVYTSRGAISHSVVMRSRTGTVRWISSEHNFEIAPHY